MGKPSICVLTEQEIESIHLASLDILESVGVYLPIREVLDIAASNGAQVDYVKKIAKFPSGVAKEFISKAPSEFTLYSRNSKFNMNLRPGNMYFGVGGGATRFVDIRTGAIREATLSDLDELVTIADLLGNSSIVGELVVPVDVDGDVAPQYMWASALKNSYKHVNMYVSDGNHINDGIKMASAIVGNEEELAKKPIIDFFGCVGQPLTYEEKLLDGFVEVARHKIPLLVQSGVMAGATGPVTLAGTLALSNAEVLSGIIIAEMVNPGTPVVYTSWCRIFDMRAANVSISGPEYALFRMAVGQLVRRYYEVPICQGGFAVDSKILDMQAGYEQYIAVISMLAGTNLVLGYQMDEGNITSPLHWVISDELAEGYLRIMKGFDVNDATLALDVIRSVGVGPGRNFLATQHSHDHVREEHWLNYRVTERRSLSAWQRDGAKDVRQRAREWLDKKLKAYNPDPLPIDVQKELDKIVKEAGKRAEKSQAFRN